MIFYSRNIVLEGLKSTFQANKLYLENNIKVDKKIQDILNQANSFNVPIEYIPRPELSRISKSEEHQGVALDIEFKVEKASDFLDNFHDGSVIYISEATYEHNVGAIIRTAECAGLKAVIVPKDLNITPVIARVSSGAVFHIPIIQSSIFDAIKTFRDKGFKIFGIERGGNVYSDVDLKSTNNFFIIGGEDKSLTDNLKGQCDEILTIPQFGSVNSLNMGVAAAIVMYEYVRQNNKK